jgi:hypothetical protein
MFVPGTVYPHLHTIHWEFNQHFWPDTLLLSEQQLRQLCRCCPNLESLNLGICRKASPTALLPLLQLSALRRLKVVTRRKGAAAAAAAVLGVAAQLMGLKQLVLGGLSREAEPMLLQLTALTALEELTIETDTGPGSTRSLWNTVYTR